VLSVDTSKAEFYFDADEAGEYLLRLQPELFRSGEYNLSVSVGPSLDFPVSGSKAHVGSFWGADREGGRRSHEGIDIFAPRLTPVVAAADGYVVGVREGGLGGKTVWLRPANRAVTLYYAHLDRQLVQEGESVKKGDVIGLVGNTGNAQATAPHLHFGIYTANGPVDPLPFVNTKVKTAPPVPEKNLVYKVRLKKPLKTASGEQIQMNTTLVPLATTSKGYLLEAPGGAVVLAPFSSVKSTQDRVANPSPVELANQGGGSNKF
jgi:murein DD-endopeptidase MepM/ murein hydrolase activator NlpD